MHIDKSVSIRIYNNIPYRPPAGEKKGTLIMPCQALHLLIKPASGACDLACRYCFYSSLGSAGAQAGEMMTEECADIVISRAYETGAADITFAFQGGEPTLAGLPFFRHFVGEAEARCPEGASLHWALQTNGVHIDGQWAAFLAEHRFLTGLSLDGTRDIHDYLRPDRRGEGTYARVMEAARLLSAAGAEFNLLCVVSAQVARHGVAVYNALRKTGCRFLQFIPCVEPFEGLPGAGPHFLTPEDYAQFLRAVFPLWYRDLCAGDYCSVRYFDNLVNMLAGFPPELCGMHGYCPGQFIVEADGKVYPCDFYVVPEWLCGDLHTDTIDEIAASPARQKFVADSQSVDPACRACPVAPLCRGGCRRDRQSSPTGALERNRYCAAYKDFLLFAAPYLEDVRKRVMSDPPRA